MAEISSEPICEVLESVRVDTVQLSTTPDELKAETQAFRGHMISLRQDVHNICAILGRHDSRLERIEHRLEPVEPAC